MNPDRPTNPLARLMTDGIPLGSIAGVAVGVHPLILFLAAFWCAEALQPAAMMLDLDPIGWVVVDGWFASSMLIVTLLGSVLLHELGHVAALRMLHLSPRSLVLLPLAGGTETPGGERSPYAEFLAALAGPIVSLVLAIAATFVVKFFPIDLAESAARASFRDFLSEVAYINWLIFGVNMLLPIFPLACARIIRSLLAMNYEARRSTYDLALMGIFVSGLLVIIFSAIQFLPYAAAFSSASPFLSSLLLATAIHGVWQCHAQMRAVQRDEVYSDPEFARPLFQALLPSKPKPAARPAPRRFFSDSSSTEDAPHPTTATPTSQRRATPTESSEPTPPVSAAKPTPRRERPLSPRELLMQELDVAIKEEDFLRAAQIRDRIRALEGQESRTS